MQYKFDVSIEIKQLKKLNKFKKRPSEICPSNKKKNYFCTWPTKWESDWKFEQLLYNCTSST